MNVITPGIVTVCSYEFLKKEYHSCNFVVQGCASLRQSA
jgi:hypothetical protein